MRLRLLVPALVVLATLSVPAAIAGRVSTERPGHVDSAARTADFWREACQLFEAAHGPELAVDVLGRALLGGETEFGPIAALLLGEDPLRCGEYQISVSLPDFSRVQGVVAQEVLHSQAWAPFRSWLRSHAAKVLATTPRLTRFSRPKLGITSTSGSPGLPGPFRLVPVTVSWLQVGRQRVDVEMKALRGTTGCYLFRNVTPRMDGGQVVDLARTITIPAGTTWEVGIRSASSAAGCTLFDGTAFRWASPSTVETGAPPTPAAPIRFSGSELAVVGSSTPNAADLTVTRRASPWTVPVRLPDGPGTLWFLHPGLHVLHVSPREIPLREVLWLTP